MASNRVDIRSGMALPQRMRLAENDLDIIEDAIGSMRRLLVGILVTTASGSVMLAINVLAQLGG